MNILIDINHPGQVHLFRPFAEEVLKEGGRVLITARDKDVTRQLLEAGDIPFVICSSRKGGLFLLFVELFSKTYAIIRHGRKFKPDAIISLGSPPAAWASLILNIPHIALEDTEHSTEQALLYLPFTKYVLTSTAFSRNLGKKQLRYKGYHELAYLHPDRFEPSREVVSNLGISPNKVYSVVRFVSWQASHDIDQHGISDDDKLTLIETLTSYGDVVLTSEAPIPADLLEKCIVVPPETIHHVLAFAHLYIGEGATMASEAVMLGVPAIYTNTLSAGTLEEQARCGLLHLELDFTHILPLVTELLTVKDTRSKYQNLRAGMLKETDDITNVIMNTVKKAIDAKKT